MKAYEKYEVDEMFNNWQEDLKQLTTLNVIPIPNGATNGDVLKIMFPDVDMAYRCWFPDSTLRFKDTDWWNAPYQKGGKKE